MKGETTTERETRESERDRGGGASLNLTRTHICDGLLVPISSICCDEEEAAAEEEEEEEEEEASATSEGRA